MVYMIKANALEIRNNFGSILKKLSKSGQAVLIEKDRKPAAVLISLEDYQKRFVDKEADSKREEVIQKIKSSKLKLSKGKTSLDILCELRS